MFVELVEYLRCPESHPEVHCVLSTGAMKDREVVWGIVGCPSCQREYAIERGVVRFGVPPTLPATRELPDGGAVHALLGLSSPGGYVVLVGSAAMLAPDLGRLIEGVHLVALNAPAQARAGPGLTLLEGSAAIPLRTAMARGVVVGEEYAIPSWGAEAVRILLPGLRLVTFSEGFRVGDVERIAVGQGMWVGRKATSAFRG